MMARYCISVQWPNTDSIWDCHEICIAPQESAICSRGLPDRHRGTDTQRLLAIE